MVERIRFAAVILEVVLSRLLIVVLAQDPRFTGSQCILGNGKCSYYVSLLPNCQEADADFQQKLPTEPSDRYQEMERNLVVVRVEHARRISELESQMEKLLSSVGGGAVNFNQAELGYNASGMKRKTAAHDGSIRDGRRSLTFKDEADRGENILLMQVHKEFSGLRRELAASRRQIRNLEALLEETRSKLNRTSVALVKTASRLLETESALAETQAEKEKTAAQLSETKKELTLTRAHLEERLKELKNTTTELNRARKRNDALEVDVEKCRTEKERLIQRLNESIVRYGDLNTRHENLTREYKRKDALLIECFRGKTSQFCGFEDPKICGFVQDTQNDDLDWVRWKDKTPSALTGPSVDHTCGNNKGYYMYFDANPPGRGTKARMYSARYYGYANQCVQFYYHMHGRYIGTLNVYTLVPGNDVSPLWRAFGNQGDVWIMARLSIPANVAVLGYQVVFEGIIDRGYLGDIAVDDFQVYDGYC